jgi:protein SDA1
MYSASYRSNFITERCSGEQMAVGINAVRAICARVPSVLSGEDEDELTSSSWDVEAFVRDLAGYAKHRDRSVSIAGRGWVNFIREVYPSMLQSRDRGLVGTGLHRAGEKPLRYGEVKAASGVEGADLLVAYEASKKAAGRAGGNPEESGDEAKVDDDGWVEVDSDEDSEVEIVDDDEDASEDEAPDLVLLGEDNEENNDDGEPDEASEHVSKLSSADKAKLQQQVSSTRIFTSAEPRLAARMKRAAAQGNEFADMSDDDSDDSEDEEIHIPGAVTPTDIMADAKRKRMSKAEKLQKILEGRQKWEAKGRAGGSTNIEKKRKKNFSMSKFSFETRKKMGEKGTAKQGKKNKRKMDGGRDSKKRRRKLV